MLEERRAKLRRKKEERPSKRLDLTTFEKSPGRILFSLGSHAGPQFGVVGIGEQEEATTIEWRGRGTEKGWQESKAKDES